MAKRKIANPRSAVAGATASVKPVPSLLATSGVLELQGEATVRVPQAGTPDLPSPERARSAVAPNPTPGDGSADGSIAGSRLDDLSTNEMAGEHIERHLFHEEGYLKSNPDVASAISIGMFDSAWDHYILYGRFEGRRAALRDELTVRVLPEAPRPPVVHVQQPMPPCYVDGIQISASGGIFVVGWLDDAVHKLERILIKTSGGTIAVIEAGGVARIRRADVETALASGRPHHYGFWCFVYTGRPLVAQDYHITVCVSSGASRTSPLPARLVDDAELRNITLLYMSSADYFGNKQVLSIVSLEHSLGREIITFNRMISRAICANPYIESFGSPRRKVKGSIIVCLYGRAEYMFLQNALYSNLPGIEDYEFIYVSNSPELSEQLLREARISQQVYDINQTVVLLPGNAGFGAANNIASRYACSNRFLIVNPDVFPKDRDWAKKHTEIIENLPREQTNIFGVPLYYDDGSLMHGGMYFDVDTTPSTDGYAMTRRSFIRVEHYGKGYPVNSDKYVSSRPVPAVTGAFISAERRLFEKIGGFTEDFVFGHYEDADLCLKALKQGSKTWFHDIRLWHLEGKGSTRLPVHEGGSTVNRWLFTVNWAEFIKKCLSGKKPDLDAALPRKLNDSSLSIPGASMSASDARADPSGAVLRGSFSPVSRVSEPAEPGALHGSRR